MDEVKDREDLIPWAETAEVSHIRWLKEFEEKVWPVYETYGFTFAEAIMTYQLNNIQNTLCAIQEAVEDD